MYCVPMMTHRWIKYAGPTRQSRLDLEWRTKRVSNASRCAPRGKIHLVALSPAQDAQFDQTALNAQRDAFSVDKLPSAFTSADVDRFAQQVATEDTPAGVKAKIFIQTKVCIRAKTVTVSRNARRCFRGFGV